MSEDDLHRILKALRDDIEDVKRINVHLIQDLARCERIAMSLAQRVSSLENKQ